ncbi:MAG: class I SAM-dependent methyltransferase family protein [Nitrosopumilaceae archaeon]|jgi:tRNA (guanine37-N1)-methyltransferase|uniref:Class I SAM-dependent methyltransferase family protein n=2 Tax=Candidatus Nitrosomaritimum aestuariumsis TaxID=3342354 RepID=A0AC60W7P7_9ARCH|nr:class I SAM-dependent methyltransferase family protein [Nitrosopumilaceae archaeon]MBA4459452.1 class I SAM-dependent methyltransferase family protein [Nitrosopumilaceae archaeon]MBA4461742.1 class I SAM-dependent methyltransferase family protein [Nitrosopumilaceae archaeon]MBA4463083.1 class I SAM-dependent methyltransferase family protein [Nitrosopumilaceae archaeon]NCF22549.1 class I SAM-dependent methyltransferase family protein [Nitrosopumilaceae archaeon]
MLKKSLESILTPQESDELISAFDQIGQIIIVRIPDSLLPKKKLIGETLLNEVKIVKSVFYQASPVEGDFRTRNLEILAGEDNTETEYKEFGCRFTVDVANAFFSPRLSTERERIANLIQDGETMVNMFAGVGMFSIMAAKRKKCTVYSLDINPIASKLCEKNIELNKLAGNVISINGDTSKIIDEQLENKADRTLMLLPERSDEFLDSAIKTTKDGGIIHYYSHMHADKKSDAGKLSEEHYLEVTPVKSEILTSKIVRPVGPRYYQTVVDVKISK